MEELHIVNSWLTRLPPAVRNLTNLKVLDIDRSRLSYLPPGVLPTSSKPLHTEEAFKVPGEWVV